MNKSGGSQRDIVDRANRKIYVTLLRYIVDKTKSPYVQVRLFGTKEDERFHRNVYVKSWVEKFTFLLVVMNSVYDKDITNQPMYNVL